MLGIFWFLFCNRCVVDISLVRGYDLNAISGSKEVLELFLYPGQESIKITQSLQQLKKMNFFLKMFS